MWTPTRQHIPSIVGLVTIGLTLLVSDGYALIDQDVPAQADEKAATRTNCSNVLEKVLTSAYQGERWALTMVDACAKPQTGMMGHGFLLPHPEAPMNTIRLLGNFDQCLDLTTGQEFRTLYCTVELGIRKFWSMKITPPKNVFLDLCVPDLCTGSDLVPALKQYAKGIPGVEASINHVHCRDKKTPDLTQSQRIVIYVLLFLILVAGVSTAYDVLVVQGYAYSLLGNHAYSLLGNYAYNNTKEAYSTTDNAFSTGNTFSTGIAVSTSNGGCSKRSADEVVQGNGHAEKHPNSSVDSNSHPPDPPSLLVQILLPFSLYTNCRGLFSTREACDAIGCLHGIRILTMTLIILTHIGFYRDIVTDNTQLLDNGTESTSLIFAVISRNVVLVDVFFVISGLLTALNTLKKLRSRSPSVMFFLKDHYLHRYIRITPLNLVLVLIYAYLLSHVTSGPLVDRDGSLGDDKRFFHTWWRNVLYLDPGLEGPHRMIMTWAWYLSFDMLYILLSPVTILALRRLRQPGLCVPVLLMVGSCLMTGIRSYTYNISPGVAGNSTNEALDNWFVHHYFTPSAHLGPYLVGMMAGYYLYLVQVKGVNMTKTTAVLGWVVFTVPAMTVLGSVANHVTAEPFSNEVAALFNATHRVFWAAFVAWIILACQCGYGGILNTLLSCRAYLPVSRLSYATYMVHLMIVKPFYKTQRRLTSFTLNNAVVEMSGLLVLSLFCAALIHLLVEVPFINLEKSVRNLWNGNRQPNEKKKEN